MNPQPLTIKHTCGQCCRDYESPYDVCPYCETNCGGEYAGWEVPTESSLKPTLADDQKPSGCQHVESVTVIEGKKFCKLCGAWQSEW